MIMLNARDVRESFDMILNYEFPDYSAIQNDLYRAAAGEIYVEEFYDTVGIDMFNDKPGVLVHNNDFEVSTPRLYNEVVDVLINSYQGKKRPIIIPEALRKMMVAETLVVCHGKKSRKLSFRGFNEKNAWFLDIDPAADPDILANMYDIKPGMIPLFKKIVFVACPICLDRDRLRFAKEFLIPGGEAYLTIIDTRPDTELLEDALKDGFHFDRRITISANGTNLMTDVFIR